MSNTPPTPEQVAEARKIVAQHRAFESYTGDEKAVDEALAENIAQALSAASKVQEGYVRDDKGVERKVLGTLPVTADEYVLGDAADYWILGSSVVGPYTNWCRTPHMESGWFDTFDVEAEHKPYSTREAAQQALDAGKGEKRGM
jgi:hypothetical protein